MLVHALEEIYPSFYSYSIILWRIRVVIKAHLDITRLANFEILKGLTPSAF